MKNFFTATCLALVGLVVFNGNISAAEPADLLTGELTKHWDTTGN